MTVPFGLRRVARDSVGCATAAVVSLGLGLSFNLLRPHPLPLLFASTSSEKTAEPIVALGIVELRNLIANHAAIIIDVRPYDFFANGHVPGALSIPLSDLQGNPAAAVAKLPSDRNTALIVYCSDSSCPAAESGVRILERMGYRHAMAFVGGWRVWKEASLPVEMTP